LALPKIPNFSGISSLFKKKTFQGLFEQFKIQRSFMASLEFKASTENPVIFL